MSDSLITDSTLKFLGKAMNVSVRRQNLISDNIANLDTVGYRPQDLDFKKTLQHEMQKTGGDLLRTHEKHYNQGMDSAISAGPRHGSHTTGNADQVDIDTEMSNLVENNIKYRTSVEMLLRKMGMLKYAITEGGR